MKPEPVVFEALMAGETWYGILSGESAHIQVPDSCLVLRDAEYNFLTPGVQPAALQPEESTVVAEDSMVRPASFQLLPNYPNPFNAQTTIKYALPEVSHVRLKVYNILGQEVRVLVDGVREAGIQTVGWDGRDNGGREVSSGVYLYRLEVDGKHTASRQMLLAK